MEKTKTKIQKGDFGYIKSQKTRRFLITLGLLSLPLLFFLTGLYMTHTRKNLFTLVAILGSLPACKSMVGMIMMWMRKSMSKEDYNLIQPHVGSLVMSYEMYLTTYDKNLFLDAVAICGDTLIGYTSQDNGNIPFMEKHIQKTLRGNNYRQKVKIFSDIHPFLERMDSMNKNREILENDLKFTPDERYPDLSRAELIKHTVLAISL